MGYAFLAGPLDGTSRLLYLLFEGRSDPELQPDSAANTSALGRVLEGLRRGGAPRFYYERPPLGEKIGRVGLIMSFTYGTGMVAQIRGHTRHRLVQAPFQEPLINPCPFYWPAGHWGAVVLRRTALTSRGSRPMQVRIIICHVPGWGCEFRPGGRAGCVCIYPGPSRIAPGPERSAQCISG